MRRPQGDRSVRGGGGRRGDRSDRAGGGRRGGRPRRAPRCQTARGPVARGALPTIELRGTDLRCVGNGFGLAVAGDVDSPTVVSGAAGVRRALGSGHDDGSGTVLVVGVVVVALVLAMTLAGLGQVVVGKARAQSAADLAALAAATRLQTTADVGGACDLADQVAARNGADLSGCGHEGVGVVQVTVDLDTPFGPARSSARAGPSSAR